MPLATRSSSNVNPLVREELAFDLWRIPLWCITRLDRGPE
jgi:hypothetical protein